MIIEHSVKGYKETSYHNFNISTNGMNFTISNGSYFQSGKEKFKSTINTTITIPSENELIHYEIWLTEHGITILTRKNNEDFAYDQLVNRIDRLAWFSVHMNCIDLNYIDIHFLKVVQ